MPDFVAFSGRDWGPPQVLFTTASAVAALGPDRAATAAGVRSVLETAAAWSAEDQGPVSVLLSYEGACTLHDTLDVKLRESPWPAARVARHGAGVRFWPDGPERFGPVPTFDTPLVEPAVPQLSVPDGARARHLARVAQARADIVEGVYYQTNLAHPVAVAETDPAAALAWWAAQPAAHFSAAARLPGVGALCSLSPECLFTTTTRPDEPGDLVSTRPIKGTRPRGATPDEDRARRQALRESDKDRAEHVMIVDLLRNDLSALCGPVTVESLAHLIEAPAVFHLESTITGRLPPGTPLPAVLAALSPGGSITGAPKSSATEAIAQLEEAARGPYTGSLALFDRGRAVASILIRTWLCPDAGPGQLHVGGGIVYDSDPAEEWQETLDKAAAFGPLWA